MQLEEDRSPGVVTTMTPSISEQFDKAEAASVFRVGVGWLANASFLGSPTVSDFDTCRQRVGIDGYLKRAAVTGIRVQ